MNYSLLKSRTFWTMIFTFGFNGFQAISGQFNAEIVALINAILLFIASYFHLQTGKSTTGTN